MAASARRVLRPLLSLAVPLWFCAVGTAQALPEWPVANPFRLPWPGELVGFRAEGPAREGVASVELAGARTPVQIEAGPESTCYWSYVAVPRRSVKDPAHVARLSREGVAPGITVAREGGYLLIRNGVYAFRMRDYSGALPEPVPLSELPHWIGGVRVGDEGPWDGRAWFDGEARVTHARTEVLAAGPVFVDVAVELRFASGSDDAEQTVPALPLANGKQSHLWGPNEFPVEQVAKRARHYEVRVRFVMNDPWIDVNERFHFPRDPERKPWGVTQYWLQWGDPEGAPDLAGFDADAHIDVDTVTWVRWFLYDRFGGNVDQRYVAAKSRPDQKGRPFALLKPRWNQGGGGAQDFVAMGGGPRPPRIRKKVDGREVSVEAESEDPSYGPDNPALGVVAAFASKWVGPYPATIRAYALDGNRARLRFPMVDGERSGRHYGQRAYGLLAGPRQAFRDLNGIVRRHTDWTLEAEQNRYVLSWDRGGEVQDVGRLPSSHLFLQRRYQDDFLNPTQRATRNLPQLGEVRRKVGPGVPFGGKDQAALGYIFSDPDHWPGWHNGWEPGNPNFHTDKYMGAVYAAAALPEHPHAGAWLEYGWRNLEEDLQKALVGPDAVGAECPGYSGYSLQHQLDVIRTLRENGMPDVLDAAEAVKASGVWHRHLLTPYDYRIGLRHEAPLGDTHRWTSGLNKGFGKLAWLYQDRDPGFAAEMWGTWSFLNAAGGAEKDLNLDDWLGAERVRVAPLDPSAMDWGSHAFRGFGAVLRHRFGQEDETFLSFLAGSTAGHYHNDDLSFHFYADGHPISLDYNCSYHPRGDHAALHNSMTFGRGATVQHNGDGRRVEAMEQLTSQGDVLAFRSTPRVDLVVAERGGARLLLSPLHPEDHEFGRSYPTRDVAPIRHRRTLMMVKSSDGSVADYLVVRDQVASKEPGQINLHLLARDLTRNGPQVRATGQWDMDMAATFFPAAGGDPLRVEERSWHYFDEWLHGPGDAYALRRGESQSDWAQRVGLLAAVPAADWEPRYRKGRDDNGNQPWLDLIAATDGQALIPPPGWDKAKGWKFGEYQKWLRVHVPADADVVWVLTPYGTGTEPPACAYDPQSRELAVRHSGGVDRFTFGAGVEANLDGAALELLSSDALPALR